jgi:hypothetical protein
MVKFNDKTVMRLQDMNGGKFERKYNRPHNDQEIDFQQRRCVLQTQSIAPHSYPPHSSSVHGLHAHLYIG